MIPQEELSPEPNLSPELARGDPDTYVLRLLETTERSTRYTVYALVEATRRGLIKRVGPNPDTWVSHGNEDGVIELGAQPWPASLHHDTFIESDRYRGDLEKTYLLSHEVAHQLAVVPQDESMHLLLEHMRATHRQTGRGYSYMSQLDFYKEQEAEEGFRPGSIRGLEDLAELTNLYLIDPAILKKHLERLSDPNLKEERQHRGLVDLDPEHVATIFSTIERTVRNFLRN